jgi:hypothetical protein
MLPGQIREAVPLDIRLLRDRLSHPFPDHPL